jgi:hypothetical protein
MEEYAGPEGETLFVDTQRAERGTKGPFLVAFADADADRRWGYFCSHCEAFDNAMDSMGRIRCNVCSNVRKPDEWDAAHE